METKRFEEVYDYILIKSIDTLIAESSKLKLNVVRRVIMKKDINKSDIRLFESFINNHLRFWTEHAESISDILPKISKIKDSDSISALDYDYVKPFIYAEYDYASVLQFVDGVFKGIDDGKFRDSEDIEDFRNHVISKAFDDNEPDVAGLLDSVLNNRTESLKRVPVDKLSLGKFNSVKSYSKMFKKTDRSEIYRSITKVIEYLLDDSLIEDKLKTNTARLYITAFSLIIDYITYILAAYACRIFIISIYCAPFIRYSEYNHPKTESADLTIDDISEQPEGVISNVFHTIEDSTIRDIRSVKGYFEKFIKSLRLLEVDQLMGDKVPTLDSPSFYNGEFKRNKLYHTIETNSLYHTIMNINLYGNVTPVEIKELHQTLKYGMHNKSFGIEGIISPRNELLSIITNTNYDKNLNGYKTLMRDLYYISLEFTNRMIENLRVIDGYIKLPSDNTIDMSSRKSLTEISLFLSEIYKEVMFAIGQKAGFIETIINELRDNEIKRDENLFSLDIKGLESDTSEIHKTMLSVPDTSPNIIDNTNLYSMPVLENFTLYREYLQTLPMFANDLYLSEAGSGKIIDAIIAMLKSLWTKISKALESAKFQAAKNWVVKNENVLINMKFPDNVDMDILPYKENIKLPDGFNKFISGLKGFNENSLKDLNAYKRSLYPNDTIYKWFNDDPKTAPQKYMNSILFDDGTDKPVKMLKITQGNKMPELMKQWINNIKSADKIIQDFKTIGNEITNAVTNIKNITVKVESNNNKPNGPTPGTTPPPNPSEQSKEAGKQQNESVLLEDGTTSPGSSPAPASTPPASSTQTNAGGSNGASNQNQSNIQGAANSTQEANAITQEAINRLWVPIGEYIIGAIFKQYGYIKILYVSGTQTKTQ